MSAWIKYSPCLLLWTGRGPNAGEEKQTAKHLLDAKWVGLRAYWALLLRSTSVSMGSVNPFSFEGWSESQTESKVLDGMRERWRGHAWHPGRKLLVRRGQTESGSWEWELVIWGRVWERVKGHQQRTILDTIRNHGQKQWRHPEWGEGSQEWDPE